MAQLTLLLIDSFHFYSANARSFDTLLYVQPWFEIPRGHLDAYSTAIYAPFIGNHGEFIIWIISPLSTVLSPFSLLVVQDIFVCCCGIVASITVFYFLDQVNTSKYGNYFRVLCLILIFLNPFVIWSTAADFHVEAFGTLFLLLLTVTVLNKSKWSIFWLTLCILCGSVAILWLVGLSLSFVIIAKTRKIGCS